MNTLSIESILPSLFKQEESFDRLTMTSVIPSLSKDDNQGIGKIV